MKLFLTKVWGFDEPCGPLVFNSRGWRDRAIANLHDGDRVILVGTLNEKPDPADVGRLLGMMQPTKVIVSAVDFPITRKSRNRDEYGSYRWPFGLLNSKAWVFDDKPEFKSLVLRKFFTDAAVGIVELLPDETKIILAQKHHEVALLESTKTRERLRGEAEAMRRGAPPPSTSRRGIMHMRNAPASTYVFALLTASGQHVGYKVGWAFDWRHRLREFNKISNPGLGGIRYRATYSQLWDTARQAFRMEQDLLGQFDPKRHIENREILVGLTEKTVEDAWSRYISDAVL